MLAKTMERNYGIGLGDYEKIPEMEYLIHQPLPLETGVISLMIGKHSSNKSFIALDILFQAYKANQQVFYYAGEGAKTYRNRLPAFIEHYKINVDDLNKNSMFLTPFDLKDRSNVISSGFKVNLEDADNVNELIDLIRSEGLQPKVMVFDTLHTVIKSKEDDEQTAKRVYANAGMLIAEFGCTVHIIHHLGKDNSRGARGTYAWESDADLVTEVKKLSSDRVVIHCKKNRSSHEFDDMHLEVKPLLDGLVLEVAVNETSPFDGFNDDQQNMIFTLAEYPDGQEKSSLIKLADLTPGSFGHNYERLKEAGVVTKKGSYNGRYMLTEKWLDIAVNWMEENPDD